ncbi:MAG: hypothetical protein HY365_00920 [Candidatus Aenigmarchaeota archaeon]|nr:hypothetical protein [Candidatus Aenigmarchaeota archaeon]
MGGDRKYITMIALYALLLVPAQYLYGFVSAPEGTVAIKPMDLTYLAAAKSVLWNGRNPWPDPDASVFADATLGSSVALVPLGLLWLATGIDPLVAMIALNTAFTFGYLYAIMLTMKKLAPNSWHIALPLLLFAQGIGGLLYFPLKATGLFSDAGLGNLFWGWMTSEAVYQTLSLLTGWLAFYFFISKKTIHATASLALTFLVYPIGGLLFAGMTATYSLFTKRFKESLTVIAQASLFLAPWIYFIMTEPVFFTRVSEFYATPILSADKFIFTLLVNGGLALAFAVYGAKKARESKEGKFLLCWAGLMFLAVLSQLVVKKIDVTKLLVMTWPVLAMLAGEGMVRFAAHFKVPLKTIFIVTILVSLPSFMLFYGNVHVKEFTYFSNSEIEAMGVLKDAPQGVVLAPPALGRAVPYYAEKRSVTGGVLSSSGVLDDYDAFYNGGAREIREKYNISYLLARNGTVPDGFTLLFANDAVRLYGRELESGGHLFKVEFS